MLSRRVAIAAGLVLLMNASVALAEKEPPQVIAQPDGLFGVTARAVVHAERAALRIELSDEEQAAQIAGAGGNRPTFAVLDIPFANGVIEVDIAAEINGRGGKDARGFAGIAFHLTDDGEAFEAVYLRMANGTANIPAPPAPRNIRAIQYISHPGFHFAESRAERPAHYEKATDLRPSGPSFISRVWPFIVHGLRCGERVGSEAPHMHERPARCGRQPA